MGFRESLSKGIGKANDFITDKQRRYRLQQSLDEANLKLASLFSELGKIYYYGAPISEGRTANVVKDDIAQTMNTIETLKKELAEPSTTA